MDEATIQGAEPQTEASTSNDDAALLSAYLAQEQESKLDGVDNTPDPAGQVEAKPESSETFTVKIDGEEKQVSRDELIAHYQKEAASQKRFEEAANLRREAEQQKAEYLQHQQLMQKAVEHFNNIANQWANEGQPDWADLLENNPHEYLRQKQIWEARSAEMQKAQMAQAYLQQQQQQQQEQFLSQHLQKESERITELLPEWKNPDVRTRDEKDLIDYLKGQGYSNEDLAALNRSRASNIKLAMDAMKYNRLLEQAKTTSKKVGQIPARAERPGVANVGSNTAFAEAKARLSKSGSIDDATAAFAAMFG